jgi:hypothetical protein
MALPVAGLDGEDQQKMSYSPSGQPDRFQRTSSIHATLFRLGESIAEFRRGVTWPTPHTRMKLQVVPVRTPRGQRDS